MKKILSIVLLATMLFSMFAIPTAALADYHVVIGSGVNVRKSASTSAAVVRQVGYGYDFKAHTVSNGFIHVNYSSSEWIKKTLTAEYHSPPAVSSKTVSISSGNLAVRQAPTTNAPSLGSYSNGTTVSIQADTVYQVNGHYWHMVYYGGQQGWVSATYLR